MKRIIAGTLTALLLICFTSAAAAYPGSPSDPLASLSYVTGTFMTSLLDECRALVDSSLRGLLTDAESRLRNLYASYSLRLGSYEDYTFAGQPMAVSLPAGSSVELLTGSTFVLTSGSASLQVSKGTVVNISTGQEVPSASTVMPNQRYFCAEDTSAVFTSTTDSVCIVDGYYRLFGAADTISYGFLDVKSSDWFYDAVTYVNGKGLFAGTSSLTFSPQMPMTRGMFVTVLHRLAGKPAAAQTNAFPDVPEGQYYAAAVAWASANGIVNGYSDGRFHPDEPITREQMAAIMHRYASFAGYPAQPSGQEAFNSFPDGASVSQYALEAVKWATSYGLIKGMDGKIAPQGTATRAQVAQILTNFCRSIAGV